MQVILKYLSIKKCILFGAARSNYQSQVKIPIAWRTAKIRTISPTRSRRLQTFSHYISYNFRVNKENSTHKELVGAIFFSHRKEKRCNDIVTNGVHFSHGHQVLPNSYHKVIDCTHPSPAAGKVPVPFPQYSDILMRLSRCHDAQA